MLWYLDTSAVTKLIVAEPETDALLAWLESRASVLSDLHRTELRRSAARRGARAVGRADSLLRSRQVVRIDPDVFDTAGHVGPPSLRSLDALHIAAAQTLGPDLAGIVAYDHRLLAAASAAGIEVASPGAG